MVSRYLRILMSGLVVTAALSLISCSGSGDTSISDKPIPDANVMISVVAYPDPPVTQGKTNYVVYAQFHDGRTGVGANQFSNADIVANGVRLTSSSATENYLVVRAGLLLAEGDTLNVDIRHSIIGTIKLSATVPAGVPAITLTPALPAKGTPYGQTTTTMNWTDNGKTAYEAQVLAFDSNNLFVLGHGHTMPSGSSYLFTANDLTIDGKTPLPYFEFSLAAVNTVSLTSFIIDGKEVPGFQTNSAFRVQSAFQPKLTNRP